jgi:hypothetical protein
VVGSWSGSSPAVYDPHAFNYFPEKKRLAIPYTNYLPFDPTQPGLWGDFTSELYVYNVDPSTGFTPLGALNMTDVYRGLSSDNPNWSFLFSPQIQRSVMADDYVYAVSDAGIRVATVTSLGTPVATAPFAGP